MTSAETDRDIAEPLIARHRTSVLRLLVKDPFVLLSVCWLLIIAVSAAIGPELLGKSAIKLNLRARNTPPGSIEKGWLNVLGTDSLGRSMVSRLVVASRNTLAVALSAALLSMVFGSLLGLFAGYLGRWPSHVIMRFSDVLQSFPSLLLAVIVLYILEPRVYNLVIVLAITRFPIYIRVTRAEVMEIRERLFVDAARVLGSSRRRIIFRHIVPVVLPTVATILTVDFAFVMLAESGLSFLGIGINDPMASWGQMVGISNAYIRVSWHMALFPTIAIALTMLGFRFVGDGLRDALDPKMLE